MKDIITDPATSFDFKCAEYVPFKDREICERLRKISGKDLEKHWNPTQHPENDAATLHDKPLGYAYVPIQRWRMMYTPEHGLGRGTIFEELDMPMEVYGNE